MDYNNTPENSEQEKECSIDQYIGGERIIETRCQKLLSHNWLKGFPVSPNKKGNGMIEVRFKNSHKEFFNCPPELEVKEGDVVAVEATMGHDIGIVSLTGDVVEFQYNRKESHKRTHEELKKVYRKARLADIEKWIVSIDREHETLIETRKIVEDLKLGMKLNDVEYQGDNTKAIFYYTAEDRVDFRELIKILAERFRIRIEMKQIGIRQEAARMGGLGSCGRELCCSSWTSVFQSVSTQTARSQQLPLNPQKLAGQCCKLKCCLNFEQDVYVDSIRYFPQQHIRLRSKEGEANFVKMDVFKKLLWYAYSNVPNNNQLMVFELNKVWEIIKMNENRQYPEKLEDLAYKKEANTGGFSNMQNQDDLNRFDKNRNNAGERSNNNRPNNKGNRPNGNRSNGNNNRINGAENDASNNHRNNEVPVDQAGGNNNRQNGKNPMANGNNYRNNARPANARGTIATNNNRPNTSVNNNKVPAKNNENQRKENPNPPINNQERTDNHQ
ncbi:MAG: regulatory iron-sulfur-containing complex subunit RicT [Bacteroidales bacterium]|nr:regulatory iron-sulfur-containing complex subunit RicT [Bacteroidales bacterium]